MDDSREKETTARRCPCCHAELTLRQAVEILNGSGFQDYVWVEMDGAIMLIEASRVNPKTMTILD